MSNNESEDEVNCTIGVPVQWGSISECGNLPLAVILLLAIAAGWGLLFVVTGVRRTKHSQSASRNTITAKKMQHLQAWFYSFFHTMVYATTMFSVGSLAASEEYISTGVIVLLELFAIASYSQVDVLGSLNKKQGINDVDGVVMGQYLITSYLPMAVWKTSGHLENPRDAEPKTNPSKLSQLCCTQDLSNPITPSAYDVKDVAGMQGAFVGLPVLLVYMLTLVRANGADSVEEVDNDLTFQFDVVQFDLLTAISVGVAFLSAMLPPLLGDWETYKKSVVKSAGSVVVRALEVIARVGFYTYFVDSSTFKGFLLMGFELFFMYMTNITARESSAGGRTGTVSHHLLSSWESVFFNNYRRISVDKELQVHSSLMPAAIELVRFFERTGATLLGYILMATGDFPDSYMEAVRSVEGLPIMFFFTAVANFLVVVVNSVSFGANSSKVKRSDLKRLGDYWKTLPPFSWCCQTARYNINRDYNFAEGTVLH